MTTDRITAPRVMTALQSHIDKHDIKYDTDIKGLQVVMFGENNDDGLVTDVLDLSHCCKDIQKRLSSIEGYNKWAVLLVFGTLIVGVINLLVA